MSKSNGVVYSILAPGSRPETLGIYRIPGRKSVALVYGKDGTLHPLAYFRDPADADTAERLLDLLVQGHADDQVS